MLLVTNSSQSVTVCKINSISSFFYPKISTLIK